ncbi:MAG: ABC transporter ATP-binding protein, partial [Candidatus Eisenbacteria bacterium]
MELVFGPLLRGFRETRQFGRILVRFRPYLRTQYHRLALAMGATIGYTIVTLLEPWPLQILFDAVLLKRKLRVSLPGVNLAFLTRLDPHVLLVWTVL